MNNKDMRAAFEEWKSGEVHALPKYDNESCMLLCQNALEYGYQAALSHPTEPNADGFSTRDGVKLHDLVHREPVKQMSDGELLPCPFCGGHDLDRAQDTFNATDRVTCRSCKANAVLWKWNNRHESRSVDAESVAKAMFHAVQPILEFNSGFAPTWENIVDYGRDCYLRMAKAAIALCTTPTAPRAEPEVRALVEQASACCVDAMLKSFEETANRVLDDNRILTRLEFAWERDFWIGHLSKAVLTVFDSATKTEGEA